MKVRTSRGFTLLEVMISSVLLFICISIVVISFISMSRNFAMGSESVEAFQDCRRILELITTELREAEPATLVVGSSMVKFEKYHMPHDENHVVTWIYDSSRHKVIRRYTTAGGHSGEMEFGENVMDLAFSESAKGTPPGQVKTVKISIDIKGRIQSPSGERRNIISLDAEACLRANHNAEANVRFVSP
jgi:hypothetical protein